MKSKRRSIAHVLTLLLVCAMVPVSGPAQTIERKAPTKAFEPVSIRSDSARPEPVLGKLLTRRNGLALINGNGVGTGGTIFSGATIETPTDVRALVQVGRAGNFYLSPNTTATLQFNSEKMTAVLKRGCLTLSPLEKVEGVIVTPDGASTRVDAQDPSKQRCTNITTQEPERRKSGLLGLSPLWTWVLAATGGYLLVGSTLGILGRDCCDPSPSSPFGCR
jgi:hypothetical protein